MSAHKHFDSICVVVLICTLLLTVLFMHGESFGLEPITDPDGESGSTGLFTKNDLDGAWDTAGAARVTLTGDGAQISGDGAYVLDGDLIIARAGRYVLSGTLDDGGIVVRADDRAKVWIMLDGVSLHCADNACLRVEQADKVFLTLAAGSENSMESGAEYSAEALADKAGGVLYSHDDLTVNGSGALSVTAAYKHGIDVNDELRITGGSITINAPGDGLHVNDGILFDGAALTIHAGDDGIHCDKNVTIAGGSITIPACYEGIEALTIEVTGGDIEIYPTDDGFNANGGSGFGFGHGMLGQQEQSEETGSADEETWIHISGGNISIVNEQARDADGLDSNGNIHISGGVIRVSVDGSGGNNAVDYGSESGGSFLITGGEIVACGGSMMAEGFSADSSQCGILYNLGSSAAAGTTVALKDKAGAELLSYTAPCGFTCVTLSSPSLTLGETYTLVIGDTETAITLDSVSTSLGSGGGMMGGGFGGGMMRGMREGADGTESRQGMGRRGGWQEQASGEMPTPPAMNGEMPDFSAMPAPPDFEGGAPDMGQRPEMNGEMPDASARPVQMSAQRGERMQDFAQMNADQAAETASGPQPVSAAQWSLVAFSVLALALGTLFAIRYRQR